MDCRHLEDEYEVYLLGALDAGEQEEVKQHVRQGCTYCADELREAAETLYWLLQNVPPVRPSPVMKTRLLQRLTPNTARAGDSRRPRAAAPGPRGSGAPRSRR